MNSWCWHPLEELLRVFYDGRVLADRRLCGLCGELVYALPPPVALAVGPLGNATGR